MSLSSLRTYAIISFEDLLSYLNAGLEGGGADLGVLGKLVGRHPVHREVQLHRKSLVEKASS